MMSIVPTFWALLFPRRYVDTDLHWDYFDFREWHYTWREDPWNGLLDTLQPPFATIHLGRGDCEDYAFAVASYLLWIGKNPVGIAVAGRRLFDLHVVAYDDEHVYSSGRVTEESVDEWLDNSEYNWVIRRPLT